MEKEKRSVNKMTFIAALSLTILIFVLGIFLGNMITQGKVNEVLSVEKESTLQLENLQMEELFLKDTPCQNPSLLTESLEELGTKLTYLESEYSKNDSRILDLKKPYTLLEIRHYLAMKNMIEQCHMNYTLILFFYSNDPSRIHDSEEQGFVLDYLRKKYENIKAYSFDADMDLGMIKVMKDAYNLKVIPSMVIDDKVYAGLHPKEELERLFENK